MSFLLMTEAFDFKGIFKTVSTKWYFYVAVTFAIALIVCFLTVKKQPRRDKLTATQKICYISVLSALSALSQIFDVKISDAFQISFIATVGFVTGYLFGGGVGFAVCFIGDLVGSIISPKGAYNPIIAFGTGLWGFIPGIIFSYFKGNNALKLVISFILSIIIISGGINTLGIYLMYGLGKNTFAYYLGLFPLKLCVGAVNAVLSFLLMRVLPRILSKNNFDL